LEHPGDRWDRIAGIFLYLADRTNCLVRLGLFFDGNPGASAQVLAQAPAGSGQRSVKHRARSEEQGARAGKTRIVNRDR